MPWEGISYKDARCFLELLYNHPVEIHTASSVIEDTTNTTRHYAQNRFLESVYSMKGYNPPKTNMTLGNRKYMFKWLCFHCHVSFPGCSALCCWKKFLHFRPTEHRHLSPFRQARRRESSLQEQAEELQQLDRTLLKSARVHRPYAFQRLKLHFLPRKRTYSLNKLCL